MRFIPLPEARPFPPRAIRGGILFSAPVALLLILACATVPITGRRQVVFLSETEEIELGRETYRQILAEEKLSRDTQKIRLVERVGKRIAKVAEKPEFQWEFKVIEKNVANAWALPGGKVAVYTGILPVTKTEAGLAVVMGHEIAHAIARHGAERMSHDLIVQYGVAGIIAAVSAKNPEITNAVKKAFGLGTQIGIMLPFSRKHESEADHIGLILMAKAGYDPAEAVHFWQRMKKETEGKSPPEFLSTHPSHDTRITQIKKWLPEARKYYRKP